jgi:hypothetical protein
MLRPRGTIEPRRGNRFKLLGLPLTLCVLGRLPLDRRLHVVGQFARLFLFFRG